MNSYLIIIPAVCATFLTFSRINGYDHDHDDNMNIDDPIWPRPASSQYESSESYWKLHPQRLEIVFDSNDTDYNNVRDILMNAERRYSANISAIAAARPTMSSAPSNVVGHTSEIHVSISTPSVVIDLSTSEDYHLEITPQAGISITATTVFGILRGLQTFSQLIEPYRSNDNNTQFYIRCMTVDDGPAFPFRGLMIDTARHFLPISIIEKILDGMEMDKLNVLHWHVSDDQSFPYKSQSNVNLSQAAFSSRMTYSPDDVRRISRAALMKGIRIVVEFDTPGHSASFGVGYPHVIAECPNVARNDQFMINPVKSETRHLISSLLQEAVDVFGPTDLIHLGGDEVDTDCLEDCKELQDYMHHHGIEDANQLLADYQIFLQGYTTNQLHKTPIVWEEVFNSGLPVGPDTIVDVWYTVESLPKVVQSGRRALFSSCWYLDHLWRGWLDMYNCDPLDFDGDDDEKRRVLGGHSCMWGERVDETNAISRIWPRASAVAERLWSRQDLVNDASLRSNLENRLDLHRCRMVSMGIGASPVRPGHCAFQ